MKLLSFILILSFIPFATYAVPESQFQKIVVKQLYPSIKEWSRTGTFKGALGKSIHYQVYGKNSPQTKPVVIVPGWTESSLKYIELAYDLIQNSYSPVYVFDHRGQGASERLLPDPEKAYVEDFLFYVKDLKTFLDTKVIPEQAKKDLQLISHSMGSVITLFYVLDHPNSFQSIVLAGPMLKIAINESIQNLFLSLSSLSQFLFRHQSFLITKRIKKVKFYNANPVSQSVLRYEFNKQLEITHSFYLRGATLKWLEEAIEKPKIIRGKAEQFKIPILILSAEKDRVVNNETNYNFCLKAQNCKLINLQSSKHEILMEKDEIRNKALKSIFNFWNSLNP